MFLSTLSVLLFVLSALPQQQPAAPPRSFQIAGVVVDALSGQPLSHTQVLIQSQSIANSAHAATTGDDGRFVFENLAPGQYALSARRRGYIQQAYKQHEFFSTAIIVGPDLDTSNLRFPLPPDAAISGQIVDELNDPVRNAQVLLFQQGLQVGRHRTWQQSSAPTDDQGRYRFGHLLPGTYFIAVSAQPWYAQRVSHQLVRQMDSSGTISEQEITNGEPELDLVYPVTFFSNATDISGAAPITLHPGDAETADLALRPTHALHLTISYVPSGKPDEPENVWPQVSQQLIEGLQQQLPVSGMQNRPGFVEVMGVPPGRLNLTLRSSHGSESTSRSLAVQVAADADLNMSEAAPMAGLSGIAKLDDGSPVQQGVIGFHNRISGEQFTAQIQDTGEFKLEGQALASGTYDVSVGGSSAQAVRSMSATGAKVSGRSLEIIAGQDAKLNVIVSRGTGHITGVALKDGKPLDAVMIVLVPQVPEHNLVLFRRDQSDSDGSFILRGVIPGKYTLIALENGWDLDWFTPGVLQKYLPAGEPVVVSPNSKLDVKVKVQQP